MNHSRYSVRIDYEAIKIPPVTDILVLGSAYKHGKLGILEAFKFLVPDEFEYFDYTNKSYANIGTLVINKKLINKIPFERILKVLEGNVFKNVEESEAININFNVRYYVDNIEIGDE